MLLIWGTKGRTSVTGSGQFYCPDCQAHHNYDHKEVKRWFTFFFIPIFPFNTVGDYIECKNCNSTFNTRVLEFDPEKQQEKFEAAFSIAAKRVMFKMALADGEIDDREIDQITLSFSNIAKRVIEKEDIAAELDAARDDKRSVTDYVRDISGELNDSGKEIVIRAAIAVAKADEHVDETEIKELQELCKAIDLPAAYAKGIFAEEGIAA